MNETTGTRQIPRWKRTFYELIAREISRITRYFDRVLQWRPSPADSGYLLECIDAPVKEMLSNDEAIPDLRSERDHRTGILLNGTLNRELNIQELFVSLRSRMARTSRIVVVAYNPYLSFLYRLTSAIGLRAREASPVFVTTTDLRNLAKLSGLEIVRVRPAVYLPWRLLGLGTLLNFLVSVTPILRSFSLVFVITLRPLLRVSERPSLSIVIPARNERGNIEQALKRMPDFGAPLEILFVEGHSSDGTWEEIERVVREYSGRFKLVALRQTGKGKSDAVRLGFAHATSELLTILDGDLTMPPELLGQFYEAWLEGHADFINGSRLVYPMEGDAMRFLNRLGNIFFAKTLSFVLDVPIGDSLCGTKLVAKHDYARMVAWRRDFGDFDPFGDFELLFPAAILGLGVVDVPVRYRARTYGTTNIHRFRHGAMLLKMTIIGFLRVKAAIGRQPRRHTTSM